MSKRHSAAHRATSHPAPDAAPTAARLPLKTRLNQWIAAHPGWIALGCAVVGMLIVVIANKTMPLLDGCR